ncbi:MAG: 16S rRNA (cytosine(1402)-N(4))-methyltransferase [Deltaproteobacteria bacterium]|nr:MAG: 16S rRNA (cytosine(1402)-N(4))-methyltransferase [Deltaproteobacteria bacterium]
MPYHHTSVMPEAVMRYLNCRPGGVYVDGTLGGAGHACRILEQVQPAGTLIGIDQDADAISHANALLVSETAHVHLVHANFDALDSILARLAIPAVDGILVDLGLSQHQIDASGRGFSFRLDEPLDMRMDVRAGQSAADIINTADASALANIFFKFGEERFSRKIARRIVERRQAQPIQTSRELAELVKGAIPQKVADKQKIHPATRIFMALRIAVNRELERVERLMQIAPDLLAPGGRLCVISFHSLEDRIVKHRMRDLATGCICPKDFPHCVCGRQPVMKVLTRKALRPTDEEVTANPMSRSALLRVAERLG